MIGDHFKYKDKQAHLERSYVLKFRLDENDPLKSNHQTTDVVKHLYTYSGHLMDFKNPEISASAFKQL